MSTTGNTETIQTGSVPTGRVVPEPAFVTTHWSVVLTAGRSDTTRARSALARLCQVYWYPLYAYVRRLGHSPHDAQDLTQEAFIKALKRQDQLKDLEKAAHWLSRIASNTAIDFLRRSGRVSFSDLEDLPEPMVSSREENPEQRVLRNEHRERLEAGLEVLTTRERTALLLRDVEDMPAEEVAARLNCSKATVRSHIANARVKLRRHFERKQC